MEFGYKKQSLLLFAETVEKIKAELAKEGFGVITEIDAKETFKKKLGVEFEDYVILGACHPATALAVLKQNKEMGLMLPCNVIAYEEGGNIFVSAILPTVAMSIVTNSDLDKIAKEVEEKLKKVIDAV